jgi:D-amino-acid dehydrogenase
MKKRVAIIGGGIVGINTAYWMSKHGFDVTVFDSEPEVAMRCSHANGGQISVCNASTWNTFKNVGKGLKWMTKKDAPLLINPSVDVKKYTWLYQFVKNCFGGTQQNNTIQTVKLGLRSRQIYEQVIRDEGIECSIDGSGILKVYNNDADFNVGIEEAELFADHGLIGRVIDGDIFSLKDFSQIGNFQNYVGGIYYDDDWTGDIFQYCVNMRKVLETKYHVDFSMNSLVNDVWISGSDLVGMRAEINGVTTVFNFNNVIFCNGAQIEKFADMFEVDLGVYPVKGYSITIPTTLGPRVSILDDASKIVTSHFGDRFRVAGTAELNGYNEDVVESRIEPLVSWVNNNFPEINTSDYESWACLRPMTPNMMPIHGVVPDTNGRIAFHGGHGHLGWTLSMATSKFLADLIKE